MRLGSKTAFLNFDFAARKQAMRSGSDKSGEVGSDRGTWAGFGAPKNLEFVLAIALNHV